MNQKFEKLGFYPADILLPKGQDMTKWAVVACDQFTSEPEYWQAVEQQVGDAPSTLRLILPEAKLKDPNVDEYIAGVNRTMDKYLADDVFTLLPQSLLYVEREQSDGRIRHGLIGMVDLDAYDFTPGSGALIRATEGTVLDRIPPRARVRRGAPIELPHVMLLIDDPDRTVIEPLTAAAGTMEKLYDFDLMQGGGHIAGWAVEDPAMLAQIDVALAALGSQEAFDAKYPQAKGAKPLTLAVGDGNHSLAAAKACWEELKATLTPEERESHPARWCLAEVCNVHSPAIEIEPIHRVLFNVDCGAVLLALISWSDSNMAGICFGDSKQQAFTLAGPHVSNVLSFEDPVAPLTVGTVDEFIEYFMARHSEARVDYVHDEPAVRALTRQGGVAFLLPPFEKNDLFKGIVMGGVLPRKTFSMGHAEEKRYYIECRRIKE